MIFDLLFLATVFVMWSVIAYQLILAVAGFIYWRSTQEDPPRQRPRGRDWPKVSVLIPARNEERVIRETLLALLRQDYPKEQLEILVINDGSTDRTQSIVSQLATDHSRLRLITISPDLGGRGKSAALNIGLQSAHGELIAVYDADNTPQPSALWRLVEELVHDPELGAAVGKFRTVNRDRNLLTRFVNLETIAFQWVMQAGRWVIGRVATLPGTNYVIRRDLLHQLGGWDEQAIAEDSELSMRVYEHGYVIKFVPQSVTWEQEPETLSVWLRQRTRWARGNNYDLAKALRRGFHFPSKMVAFQLMSFLALFYVFFLAVLVSDLIFLAGLFGVATSTMPGPYTVVWGCAVVLFVLELMLVASFEGERGPRVLAIAALMHFTYCQAWIWVVLCAAVDDLMRGHERVWDKTPRFARDEARERAISEGALQ